MILIRLFAFHRSGGMTRRNAFKRALATVWRDFRMTMETLP